METLTYHDKTLETEDTGSVRSEAMMQEALAHQTYLHNFLKSKFPYFTDEDVEDVVQEVYLILTKKIGSFRGESQLRTWLTRVAWNAGLGYSDRVYKRRDKEQLYEEGVIDAFEERLIKGPALSETPDVTLLQKETQSLVQECLGRLQPEYADVVRLSDLEGHSAREIAEEIHVTVAAVKSRLHRGRMKLRDMLQHHVIAG